MNSKKGPFRVLNSCGSLDPNGIVSPSALSSSAVTSLGQDCSPNESPFRRYDCNNYETCLDLAAALDWDSFSCSGCSGKINECLLWRAHQAEKYDQVVHAICDHLPPISAYTGTAAASTVAANNDVITDILIADAIAADDPVELGPIDLGDASRLCATRLSRRTPKTSAR